MNVKIKIIQTEKEILQIYNEWEDLYHSNDALDIYQSVDWVLTWCKYYKACNELFCILIYENKQLVAIAPLIIMQAYKQRILTFIGCTFNDYNYLIIAKYQDHKFLFSKVISTISAYFLNLFDCWELNYINLNKQDFLSIDFKKLHLKPKVVACDIAAAIDLPPSLSAYYNKIVPSKVVTFQYYERRVFKMPNVSFSFMQDTSNVNSFIEWFKNNKFNTWKKCNKFEAIADELKENSFFDFLSDLLIKLIPKKAVIIPYLYYEDRILSTGIYFHNPKKINKYIQAWDYNYKSFNVGTVLDWLMIKYALSNKSYKLFDLGRGDEAYKYNFGATNIYLNKIDIVPA